MNLERIVERYTRWVVRHPLAVLVGTLAFVGAVSSGALFIEVDTDYRNFFEEDDPNLVAFEALQSTFSRDDSIFFVIAPNDRDVFTRKTLAAVEDLTRKAWKIPYATRVDSVTNFQHSRSTSDELEVGELISNADRASSSDLLEARRVALSEPQLRSRLISPSGDVTGVNVRLHLPRESRAEVPRAVAEARRLAEEMKREHPGIDVRLSGLVLLDNAFSEAVVDDLSSLVPLMYASMFIVLVWFLGSFAGAVATALMIGLSALPAMGVAGFLGLGLTPPLAQAPTMIMTLAVADTAHLLSTVFYEMLRGKRKDEAIVESMRVNYHGVFLTSLTTVIGYLSMNFSDSPPFHHLGNITAVGVAFAYLNSISFLPALVMLLPFRVHARADRPHRALARLVEIVIHHRRAVLAATVSVTLASLFFISRNRLDDGFINYFDPGTPFRADTDFAIENLTGIYSIEYAIGSGEEGGIGEPGYLVKLDEFASWYREQPHVMHVDTFTDVLKRLNRNLHDDDPAFYRLPDNRELAAQALLLYEMALPSGLDLNDRIDVEKSSTRFTVTLDNLSSRELQELDARAQDWLRQHAPQTMFARGASTSVMFVDMTLRNIKGMFVGSTLELILISGCLIFALRSFKYGLLSLVPNLVPIVIAFGVWGLLDGRVNLGVSVVAGMTFGIVVDDTVHFLIKYLRARRKHGLGTEDAVRYVFTSVGPALVSTTAVLVAGFGTLILSGFVVNSDMGKLTAMTLAIAVAGDLLLLPCLLMAVDGRSVRERSRGPAMVEAGEVG